MTRSVPAAEPQGTGWKAVALRVRSQVRDDNVSLLSAGVAFYAMPCIFPALIAGLNVAYDRVETRRFVRLRGLPLLLALGAILTMAVAVGIIVVLPVVTGLLGPAGRVVLLGAELNRELELRARQAGAAPAHSAQGGDGRAAGVPPPSGQRR